MAAKKSTGWIGFDLGGTKMMAQVFDDEFTMLGRKKRKTKGHEGKEAGLDRIARTIENALDDAGGVTPAGLGIGCPGPLDLDAGVIINAPNLGWQDVPLKKELEKRFKCPVQILNDVDAGVYGEYRFGAGQGARCVLGIFPGTGIGGGCVYDGRILRGKKRSCLEIGHMQVLPDGPLCGCGQRGCLEAVSSRLAISSAAAAAAYRGDAPALLEKAGMNLAEIRSSALQYSVENGDAAVEEIIRGAARWVGVAVANAVHLLMPDVIVLGGGLVESMPELYLEEVQQTAEKRVMDSFRGTFHVQEAKLEDDSAVKGTAAWVRECVQRGAAQ